MSDVSDRREIAPSAIELAGMTIHDVTEAQANAHIVDASRRGIGGWLLTVNLDMLRRHVKDPRFTALTRPAGLRVADGMPLIWASALQRQRLPERVCGSDLVRSLSGKAAESGCSVFLLGGNPGVADQAARMLAQLFPALQVAGSYCPPIGFERDVREMDKVRRAVTEAAPDIVYVALGSPKQEYLIGALRSDLPQAWFLGVGIGFSFLTGDVRRAPAWMQAIGGEWLYRLTQEPGRLARRYLVDDLPFVFWLLCRAVRDRRQ